MPPMKAIFFDFMGTCLDWHTGVLHTLPKSMSEQTRSDLALDWRQAYFDSNATRLAAGLGPEDIDTTLQHTLKSMLDDPHYNEHNELFTPEILENCVNVWHHMPSWPEVPAAISTLRSRGYEVFVFANGTPRLQLDLCKSSDLKFDMLFSSMLLGVYKPAPESYAKVLEMVKLDASQCVQVAAHAYDLRGAKKAGMRTVYVDRWTDDVKEDKQAVKGEVDIYLEDMSTLSDMIAGMEKE